jgi:hypothetical protein
MLSFNLHQKALKYLVLVDFIGPNTPARPIELGSTLLGALLVHGTHANFFLSRRFPQ